MAPMTFMFWGDAGAMAVNSGSLLASDALSEGAGFSSASCALGNAGLLSGAPMAFCQVRRLSCYRCRVGGARRECQDDASTEGAA